MNLKERIYVDTIPRDIEAILAADIGGTNSNFGIFEVTNNAPILLCSVHAKSQEISDFALVVKEVLELIASRYGIRIKNALFASAGVVSPNQEKSKPTNLSYVIDAHAIKRATDLQCVFIVNDFEVIGYGIDLISQKDLNIVQKGEYKPTENKAIIGAGTGLGKCIMFWSERANRYVPVASEGGHADFAAQSAIDIELIQFIQRTEGISCPISWEDVLSGKGIQRIYQFFYTQRNGGKYAKQSQIPRPDDIFQSRTRDPHSRDTYELYARYYARSTKCFALDALALGGMYIAGGIAAHNVPMFEESYFREEFLHCGKLAYLLKKIPITIIADYNVSLYGAAQYLLLEELCLRRPH